MFSLKKACWLGWCILGFQPLLAQDTPAVSLELVEIVSKPLEATTVLPGELMPYQKIDVFARVTGFVESVRVDRGSFVKKGQILATVSAPEMNAQLAEANANVVAIQAEHSEAEAKLAAAESTYHRLKDAAETPGVVAENDLVLAERSVEAGKARALSLEKSIEASKAAVHAIDEIKRYTAITAEFDGVITARFAHPGSLVGPEGGSGEPLFRLEQIRRLRLVAPVPEAYASSIAKRATVDFTVPAYPGQRFRGIVARPAFAVDPKTRTMPVELDVDNRSGKLSPGMYAEISWPVRRKSESLFVPLTAIKRTTERIFVIRVSDGLAEWVDVRQGTLQRDQAEVFGDLKAGERLVLLATDEIRPGTRIMAK